MSVKLDMCLISDFSKRLASAGDDFHHLSFFMLERYWKEMEPNVLRNNFGNIKRVGIYSENLYRHDDNFGCFRLYLPSLKLVPLYSSMSRRKGRNNAMDYVSQTQFATGLDFVYFVLLNLICHICYRNNRNVIYTNSMEIKDSRFSLFMQELQDYFQLSDVQYSYTSLLPGIPHYSLLRVIRLRFLSHVLNIEYYVLFAELSLLYAYYWRTNYAVAYCINRKGEFCNQSISKNISVKDLDAIFEISNPASWQRIDQINLKPF